jgi:hypothetical protein
MILDSPSSTGGGDLSSRTAELRRAWCPLGCQLSLRSLLIPRKAVLRPFSRGKCITQTKAGCWQRPEKPRAFIKREAASKAFSRPLLPGDKQI